MDGGDPWAVKQHLPVPAMLHSSRAHFPVKARALSIFPRQRGAQSQEHIRTASQADIVSDISMVVPEAWGVKTFPQARMGIMGHPTATLSLSAQFTSLQLLQQPLFHIFGRLAFCGRSSGELQLLCERWCLQCVTFAILVVDVLPGCFLL